MLKSTCIILYVKIVQIVRILLVNMSLLKNLRISYMYIIVYVLAVYGTIKMLCNTNLYHGHIHD